MHIWGRQIWPKIVAAINPNRNVLQSMASLNDHTVRSSALQALAKNWPDDNTPKLLQQRAPIDGAAASLFGGQHSAFGRIVFTHDFDGEYPYLDPTKPISSEQIEKAVKKAHVPADKIEETVRSLSEHLGWDITKGSEG